MKAVLVLLSILFSSLFIVGQTPTDVLAVASGRSFTAQDLSPQIAQAWLKAPKNVANARKVLLDRQIESTLLRLEASARKLTIKKLIETEVDKKVADPTDAQIKAIYDANRKDIGNATLSQVRQRIVDYLRQEPQKRAYANFVASLKTKHPVAYRKDVKLTDLKPTDILATVGTAQIIFRNFSTKNRLLLYELYEYEANIFDQVIASLKQAVDSSLFKAEAEGAGITTSDYIAREITDKMRNYTDAEQARVQSTLRKNLYVKYRVRILLQEPKPFVQKISADDDPFMGDANAPVTVVMFTDLQCPACASVYPVLKTVVAEYGKRVKFVVRDFPLMSLHENAFGAAVAANAAHSQGKYFEFKELLYKNQDSLDTASLVKLAGQIGMNTKRFAKDLKSEKLAEEVRNDIKDGEKYSVNSTPTIFVNGIKVRILSADSFRNAIDRFTKLLD